MSNRCVVPGCTSADDEKMFRQIISRDGRAVCPRHEVLSTICGCSYSRDLFSHHAFPKTPQLRLVWYELLKFPASHRPKKRDCVCSRHFGIAEGLRGSHQKVPLVNIGRTDDEIRQILAGRISSAVELQIKAGFISPSNDHVSTRNGVCDNYTDYVCSSPEQLNLITDGDLDSVEGNQESSGSVEVDERNACTVVGSSASCSTEDPMIRSKQNFNAELQKRRQPQWRSRHFSVSKDQLALLFSNCLLPTCGSMINQESLNISCVDNVLNVFYTCNGGHQRIWRSLSWFGYLSCVCDYCAYSAEL